MPLRKLLGALITLVTICESAAAASFMLGGVPSREPYRLLFVDFHEQLPGKAAAFDVATRGGCWARSVRFSWVPCQGRRDDCLALECHEPGRELNYVMFLGLLDEPLVLATLAPRTHGALVDSLAEQLRASAARIPECQGAKLCRVFTALLDSVEHADVMIKAVDGMLDQVPSAVYVQSPYHSLFRLTPRDSTSALGHLPPFLVTPEEVSRGQL